MDYAGQTICTIIPLFKEYLSYVRHDINLRTIKMELSPIIPVFRNKKYVRISFL